MNILICSIIRNQEQNLSLWFNQLQHLIANIKRTPGVKVWLSVFENDSNDKTKDLLYEFEFNNLEDLIINCQNLGTKQYGSICDLIRYRNLAFYRQGCIDQAFSKWHDIKFDKITYIEPDIKYDPNWCQELILARHPTQAGIIPDVYSAWSLRSEKHPKESFYLYDTSQVRAYAMDKSWDFANENKWIAESLIKTDLGGFDNNCLHTVYSTFSCFCTYNSALFYSGIKWGYKNKRLNATDICFEDGTWLDGDTAMLCESAREKGFGNVLLNRNCIVRHL